MTSIIKERIKRILPDKIALRLMYLRRMGKMLSFRNPKTFNEKLQWLKVYDRKDLYTQLVDKYEVKKYIAETIGEEFIIPTLGVWDTFDDIDFSKLPEQFVLKCTHDSGGIVICTDRASFDIENAKCKLEGQLKTNYYSLGREWPYKDVKPRIIAEKYIEDEKTGELRDYKFFCFNGKVKIFKIDFDRFINHRANYFNIDGELLKFGELICPPNYIKELEMPKNKDLMIELAEKLSFGIPFLRVDFYEVNGKVYFGELTFYPSSGFGKFVPQEWDDILGDWLILPN